MSEVFRLSVYELSRPRRSRRVLRYPAFGEHQASQFMDINSVRLAGHLAVIAPSKDNENVKLQGEGQEGTASA
jgi:hypothetical protein